MGGRCVRMPCHHGLRPDSDYVRPCSTMELPAAPPRARDSYNLSSALTALRLGRRMFSTGRHVLLQTSHAIVLAHMKLDNGLSGTTPCTETGYETGMEGLITSCREIQRASLHGQRVNKHDGHQVSKF